MKTRLNGQEKIVIDSNVIISGFLWAGKPGKIFDLIFKGNFYWVVSIKQLAELRRILNYSKLNVDYFKQQKILNFVYTYSEIIDTRINLTIVKGDSSDNIFLECAIESNADFIVSGDKHLLNLKKFKNTIILSPKEFLGYFEN